MAIGEAASGEIERGVIGAVKDRESLGERVTAWIRGNPDVPILSTVVMQSSDSGFHCISIVVFCGRPITR